MNYYGFYQTEKGSVILSSSFASIQLNCDPKFVEPSSHINIDEDIAVLNYAPGTKYSAFSLFSGDIDNELPISSSTHFILRKRIEINGVDFCFSVTNDKLKLISFFCYDRTELDRLPRGKVFPESQDSSLAIKLFEILPLNQNYSTYYNTIEEDTLAILHQRGDVNGLITALTKNEFIRPINVSDIKESDWHSSFITNFSLSTTNVQIKSTRVHDLSIDSMYMDAATYISNSMQYLRSKYPHIQFFNDDQNIDETNYREFVKYKFNLEAFNGGLITSPLTYNPIYRVSNWVTITGSISYFCFDLPTFTKRRYDFVVNRFISHIGKIPIRMPGNGNEFTYTIHFDRNAAANDMQVVKQVTLGDNPRSAFEFTSEVKIIAPMYRGATSAYPVLSKILRHEEAKYEKKFSENASEESIS